jgi:hypothetical protein
MKWRPKTPPHTLSFLSVGKGEKACIGINLEIKLCPISKKKARSIACFPISRGERKRTRKFLGFLLGDYIQEMTNCVVRVAILVYS